MREVASWVVYVLMSSDEHRTYVGITSDLPRRLEEHNGVRPRGAKATRPGRPWRVGATYGPFETRAEALQVEYQVKLRSGCDRLSWKDQRPAGSD
jgi:putative endonuclease